MVSVEPLPLLDKLFAHSKSNATGCLEWQRSCDGSGYGQLRNYIPQEARTHRLMYIETVGPIPAGLFVLHRCDNPPCINPEHLFLGTNRDNMEDMARKGRARGKVMLNEENPKCRFTNAQIEQIREARSSGCSTAEISKKFGITRRYLQDVLSGVYRRRDI